MIYLSQHFTLPELTASQTAQQNGIDNTPDAQSLINLTYLCFETLEKIRIICGNNPVAISSGFRNPATNKLVGGVANSAHLYGQAADFTIPAFGDVRTVCKAIEPHLKDLQIDQLLYENQAWVHVGRAALGSAPRYQVMTVAGGTTTNGIA